MRLLQHAKKILGDGGIAVLGTGCLDGGGVGGEWGRVHKVTLHTAGGEWGGGELVRNVTLRTCSRPSPRPKL
jgi:hypothetical protein